MDLKDDREVGPDGQVEAIEQVTDQKFLDMLEPKIKRFKDGRMIYRVFVRKEQKSMNKLK